MKINYGGQWATIVGALFAGLAALLAAVEISDFFTGESEDPFLGIAIIAVFLLWGMSLIIASKRKYIGSWNSPLGALLLGIAVVATGIKIDDSIHEKSENLFAAIAIIVVLLIAGILLIRRKNQ